MSVISLEDARKKLEERSASTSQSNQSTPSGELGQTPTDMDEATMDSLRRLYTVLFHAWRGGVATRGRLARKEANIIAIAATENLITTRVSDEVWGSLWMITEDGLEYMREVELAFS